MMKKVLLVAFLLLSFSAFAEKPHGPKAIEVEIKVGSVDNEMRFIPDNLIFERGNYYKLILTNPSPDDHYFTSDAFSTHIFTRKVEVVSFDGKTIAELHGSITDLELKPGARVEWYFYPMTKGQNLKLFCHKKGHEEKGMVGTISITGDLK
jgi:uncharacterized cupredoxin-like copper-binding protein